MPETARGEFATDEEVEAVFAKIPATMKVRWNSSALQDFNDILAYLGEHNPAAASVFCMVSYSRAAHFIFPQTCQTMQSF